MKILLGMVAPRLAQFTKVLDMGASNHWSLFSKIKTAAASPLCWASQKGVSRCVGRHRKAYLMDEGTGTTPHRWSYYTKGDPIIVAGVICNTDRLATPRHSPSHPGNNRCGCRFCPTFWLLGPSSLACCTDAVARWALPSLLLADIRS